MIIWQGIMGQIRVTSGGNNDLPNSIGVRASLLQGHEHVILHQACIVGFELALWKEHWWLGSIIP